MRNFFLCNEDDIYDVDDYKYKHLQVTVFFFPHRKNEKV